MDFMRFFEQQDSVLFSSFMILIVMSILSWSIILLKSIRALGFNYRNKQTVEQIGKVIQLSDLESLGEKSQSEIGVIIHRLLTACRNYKKSHSSSALSTNLSFENYVMINIQNETSQLTHKFESGLVILASIGAVAPFIGLFGTVWGIFNALMNISLEGQVTIATVSAPIGEALVATAMGLFTAIPAVLAYNLFTRLNRNLGQQIDRFSHTIYLYLLDFIKGNN